MSLKFSLPLEFKASDVASTGEFSGYAAVFGNVDLGGDIILPGAFQKTLAAHKSAGTLPPLLWAHDMSLPIGRFTDMHEDRKGLFTSAKLSLQTKAASEAYALLRDGAVGGMSIGYSIPDGGAERAADGRLLKQVDLYESSLVAVPMNPLARVTAVKAMECTTPRELEAMLREHLSLSRRKSAAAANAIWPIISEREAQDDDRDDRLATEELKSMADELNTLTQLITRSTQ
jgi:HK97 family phage prohead protease